MAVGRTLPRWRKVYIDGYDLSGYSRTIGPLEQAYDEHDLTADMGDSVKGYLPGALQSNVGTLNAVFDNTATVGLHALMAASGVSRNVIVAIGIRAAPAQGDPAFCGEFLHKGYTPESTGGVMATLPFSGRAANSASALYASWGILLHENVARTSATGANTGSGFDNPTGDATTKGGIFYYQVLAGDGGTITLSVDDSANNSTWLALSGATSGSINATGGTKGAIALSTAATVRRYLRWQVAFSTSTTCTWIAALIRGYG